jgi:hypothetical protein
LRNTQNGGIDPAVGKVTQKASRVDVDRSLTFQTEAALLGAATKLEPMGRETGFGWRREDGGHASTYAERPGAPCDGARGVSDFTPPDEEPRGAQP